METKESYRDRQENELEVLKVGCRVFRSCEICFRHFVRFRNIFSN